MPRDGAIIFSDLIGRLDVLRDAKRKSRPIAEGGLVLTLCYESVCAWLVLLPSLLLNTIQVIDNSEDASSDDKFWIVGRINELIRWI